MSQQVDQIMQAIHNAFGKPSSGVMVDHYKIIQRAVESVLDPAPVTEATAAHGTEQRITSADETR
jgi:hypothetical protein